MENLFTGYILIIYQGEFVKETLTYVKPFFNLNLSEVMSMQEDELEYLRERKNDFDVTIHFEKVKSL